MCKLFIAISESKKYVTGNYGHYMGIINSIFLIEKSALVLVIISQVLKLSVAKFQRAQYRDL